jgi:hypothetical protein
MSAAPRKPADFKPEQFFAFGRELHHHRSAGINGPHISLGIESNAVRIRDQSAPPGANDASFGIHRKHGVNLEIAVSVVQPGCGGCISSGSG